MPFLSSFHQPEHLLYESLHVLVPFIAIRILTVFVTVSIPCCLTRSEQIAEFNLPVEIILSLKHFGHDAH